MPTFSGCLNYCDATYWHTLEKTFYSKISYSNHPNVTSSFVWTNVGNSDDGYNKTKITFLNGTLDPDETPGW